MLVSLMMLLYFLCLCVHKDLCLYCFRVTMPLRHLCRQKLHLCHGRVLLHIYLFAKRHWCCYTCIQVCDCYVVFITFYKVSCTFECIHYEFYTNYITVVCNIPYFCVLLWYIIWVNLLGESVVNIELIQNGNSY